MNWNPCDPAVVEAGDRVAPLCSWTLDIVDVLPDGSWVVLNHDTQHFSLIQRPEAFTSLHRLEAS